MSSLRPQGTSSPSCSKNDQRCGRLVEFDLLETLDRETLGGHAAWIPALLEGARKSRL